MAIYQRSYWSVTCDHCGTIHCTIETIGDYTPTEAQLNRYGFHSVYNVEPGSKEATREVLCSSCYHELTKED